MILSKAHFILGHASDGDARRRRAMISRAYNTSSIITLPTESFTVGVRPAHADIMDQDFVHNIKKLINPLDHASRDMLLGML